MLGRLGAARRTAALVWEQLYARRWLARISGVQEVNEIDGTPSPSVCRARVAVADEPSASPARPMLSVG